jgi:hypothetical protein
MRLLNFYLLITLVISVSMSIGKDLHGQAKWNGSGLKPNNNWSTASNWQSGSVPRSTNNVVLDNTYVQGDYTVVIDTRTIAKVNSIVINPSNNNKITLTSKSGSELEVYGSNDPVIEVRNGGVYANLTNGGIPSDGSGPELSQDEIKIEGTAFRNPGEYVVQNSSLVNFDNLIGAIAPGSSPEGKVVFNSATQSLDVSGKTLHTGLTLGGASGTAYTVGGSTDFTVKGDFKVESGVTYDATNRSSGGNLKLNRGLTVNGAIDRGSTGTKTKITGSSTQSIDGSGSVDALEVDNSSKGVDLTSDFTVKDLILTSGSVSSNNTKQLTLTGSIDLGGNFRTITCDVNLDNGGTFTINNDFRASELTLQSSDIKTNSNSELFLVNSLDLQGSPRTLDCDVSTNDSDGYTLGNDLTIAANRELKLNKGVVTLNNNSTLVFNSGATVSGADASSYVAGEVKKKGSSDFKFPVGKAGQYAPIEITNFSSSSDFTAQYFKSKSRNHNSSPNQLNSVSPQEHWDLSRTGSAEPDVTLYWNSSGNVNHGINGNSLTDLRVARYDNTFGRWVDEGNTNTTGNGSDGSLKSGTIKSFSDFTFGSTSGDNPLPVELMNFMVNPQEDYLQLNWATASETNNKHFLVQKRVGEQWKNIGTVEGNGTTIEKQNYTFRDGNVQPGHTYYYRLKQVDFDGSFEYSAIKTGKLQQDNAPGASNLAVYPNPVARDVLYYRFSSADQQAELLQVINARGEVVHQQSVAARGRQQKGRLSMGSLQPGVYLLQVVGQKTTMQERFIKQ